MPRGERLSLPDHRWACDEIHNDTQGGGRADAASDSAAHETFPAGREDGPWVWEAAREGAAGEGNPGARL